MQEVRDHDGDRVGINGQRHGDCVEKDGDNDSSPGAGHGETNNLVRKGFVATDLLEELAAVQEGVSDHAHVFLMGNYLYFGQYSEPKQRRCKTEKEQEKLGVRTI